MKRKKWEKSSISKMKEKVYEMTKGKPDTNERKEERICRKAFGRQIW